MSKRVKFLLIGLGVVCVLSIILNIILIAVGNHKDSKAEADDKNVVENATEIQSVPEKISNTIETPTVTTPQPETQTINYQTLKSIIAQIRQLGSMSSGAQKKEKTDQIKDELSAIKDNFPSNGQDAIKKAIDELGKPVTQRDPDDKPGQPGSNGHCNSIANNLEKIMV